MQITDLSGQWEVFLDENKQDSLPEKYPDRISMPDSTSNAGLGKLNAETEYGCLTDLHKFEGFAWFRRTINITPEMAAQNLTLFLERTRKTRVYLDGKLIGDYCSLCTPHRYSLTGTAPGEHQLVVRVDNTDYPTGGGHLTSRDTQTNWNGIVGRLELQSYSARPEYIYAVPDPEKRSLHVRARIVGADCGSASLRVFDLTDDYGSANAEFSMDEPLECDIALSDNTPLWSDYDPAPLSLELTIGGERYTVTTGLRRLSGDGRTLLINGRQTFLRGKHDGLVFPQTGYMPTDVDSWLKFFGTLSEYGINHVRYHTCCPPDAAFEAADILGIFLQPELPFWGTVPDEFGVEHEFLREEGWRMLREFGHHPSFVMMSMGNELWGSKERLNELIAGYKAQFPDKLYAGGSNNFQFVPCVLEQEDFFSGVRLGKDRLIRGSYAMCDAPQGHIQTNYPNSIHNYDPLIDEAAALGGTQITDENGEIMIQYGTEMRKVKAESWDNISVHVPVISHEVGQYAIFPDFDEIAEYKGPVHHEAYAAYKKGLEEAGMLHRWRDFFHASGALAADCYRRDIETALRSSMMSGFQLLDIQDFPGQGVATVGILNANMRSKGLITPEEWRRFCAETVVLAELDGFVYSAADEIQCGLLISSTEPGFSAERILWELVVDGQAVDSGAAQIKERNGRIYRAESIAFTISCDRPVTAELHISVEGEAENSYKLYIYPDIDVKISETEIAYNEKRAAITHDIEQAKNGKALYVPLLDEQSLAGEYCTDFWCYGMFRSISESMGKPVPTGTLGLLINKKSELLRDFPCESHTTPQWYEIVKHSRCADLDGTDIEPEVWVIDNPERRKRLGLLYRRDGALCCTSRLWEIADRPEARWFALSLLEELCK
ncbi:MAG: beta-galactosidase [Oscillospiraceae bacterium]|nr:beta-galactosidase [Oscillospiraceae bacterium]